MDPTGTCLMVDCSTSVRLLSGGRFHSSLVSEPVTAGPSRVTAKMACTVWAPFNNCAAFASSCAPWSWEGDAVGDGLAGVEELPPQAASSNMSSRATGRANLRRFIGMDCSLSLALDGLLFVPVDSIALLMWYVD